MSQILKKMDPAAVELGTASGGGGVAGASAADESIEAKKRHAARSYYLDRCAAIDDAYERIKFAPEGPVWDLCDQLFLMTLDGWPSSDTDSDESVDPDDLLAERVAKRLGIVSRIAGSEPDLKHIVRVPAVDPVILQRFQGLTVDNLDRVFEEYIADGLVYDSKYPHGINPKPDLDYMIGALVESALERQKVQKFNKLADKQDRGNLRDYEVPVSMLEPLLCEFIRQMGINVLLTVIQHLLFMGWPCISINTGDSAFEAMVMVLLQKYGAVPPCKRDDEFYENCHKYRSIPWSYTPFIEIINAVDDAGVIGVDRCKSWRNYINENPKITEYNQLFLVCPQGLKEMSIIRTLLPENVLAIIDNCDEEYGTYGSYEFRNFLRAADYGAPINNEYYYQWHHSYVAGEELYMRGDGDKKTVMSMIVLRRLRVPKGYRGKDFLNDRRF